MVHRRSRLAALRATATALLMAGMLSTVAPHTLSAAPVAAAATPATAPAHGKKLLYVMNYREVDLAKKEDPPRPALVQMKQEVLDEDWKVVAHLKSLGFDVVTCDETADVAMAKGKDLVAISESVNAYEIAGKYGALTIPVIVWENDVLDDMRMTGKRLRVDYGTYTKGETMLQLFSAPHPLSAGLAAGVHPIFKAAAPLNWGLPGLGATVVATLPDQPDKVAIFAYERGATMEYDYTAPARRVGFFPNRNYFDNFTPDGLALFDAAFLWAVSPAPAVPKPGAAIASTAAARLLYVRNAKDLELAKAATPLDTALVKHLQKTADNDAKIVERFKSSGYQVTVADETAAGDGGATTDVIVISNSVNTRLISTRLAGMSTPIVTWASDLFPVLHMTGGVAGTDYGTTGTVGGKDGDRFASIVNAPHPLAGGLKSDLIQDLYDDNEFITNWGKPGLGAINIAVIEGYPDKRLVFGYEKGASMAGDAMAPGRRVAYFVNTEDFGELQPAGLTLLDAAVRWAANAPR